MSDDPVVANVLTRLAALDLEANAILATHEAASARVMTLEPSYDALGALSIGQDELFRESLRAVEVGLYRAAHVLAWAGFVDYLHELLGGEHLAAVQTARAKWKLDSAEDFREYSEFQVIEAGKAAGVYRNTMMKAMHGLLNRRNECAHPTDYFPDLNETLGYIGELIKRVKQLQALP
jgi:hypothetical protein